ncbi:MAG: Glu/Leu/Phe/Val dehydrogenase [Chloroflexi bacterium]|nr:Glu/Leu/Phe/Val dehydrogenase [Chloroflexota bacterium]
MKVLEYMERYDYEQLSVYTDRSVGLRAFIAIHDTTLGPALGGTRIWPHPTEEDALSDVLRLARAMTYKNAAAGLNLGGGKALIIADASKDKTETMMRAYGQFVESLGGRYVTTEDVGSTTQDMEWIAQETSHVTGLPVNQGGSGDPSQMTGFGVYQGMKACAKEIWGSDSLQGRVIAMQGYGKVASYLTEHLLKERVQVIVADVSPRALERARKQGLRIVEDPQSIFDVECDIFAPCALGGAINSKTIPRLKGKLVAGCANNQLLEEGDADALQKRGILYAPDFIINAGGVINLSFEIDRPYDEEAAREKTARIYDTMERVIFTAKKEEITTAKAADRLAEERINSVKKVRKIYI